MTKQNHLIKKLAELVNSYDTKIYFNTNQVLKIEERNDKIKDDFIKITKILGVKVTGAEFYKIVKGIRTSYMSVEQMIDKLLEEKEFFKNNERHEYTVRYDNNYVAFAGSYKSCEKFIEESNNNRFYIKKESLYS